MLSKEWQIDFGCCQVGLCPIINKVQLNCMSIWLNGEGVWRGDFTVNHDALCGAQVFQNDLVIPASSIFGQIRKKSVFLTACLGCIIQKVRAWCY